MNAVVLAYGLATGGRDGARAALADFWTRVGRLAASGPLRPTPLDLLFGDGNLDWSPAWNWLDLLSRTLSPYTLNPANLSPLRNLLLEVVDFDDLRRSEVPLYLCATNVLTGKLKVFETAEIGPDHVLASACIPTMFQAVEIDGESYWDGGFMGNPPIFPVIYGTQCPDVIIVQINPLQIPSVPKTARAIIDRMNTLNFNSSLQREMRAIQFVTRLIDEGALDPTRYKRMNMHMIDAEAEMGRLSVSSKMNADPAFLRRLMELGRDRAEAWLAAHGQDVGVRSSLDVVGRFL